MKVCVLCLLLFLLFTIPNSTLHGTPQPLGSPLQGVRLFFPKYGKYLSKKKDKFPHNQHSDIFVIAWVTFSPPAISTGRPCLISHLRLDNYIPTNKSTKTHACMVQSIPCYLAEKKEKRKDYNKRAHGQPQHTRNYEIKMMRMNGRIAQTSSTSLSFPSRKSGEVNVIKKFIRHQNILIAQSTCLSGCIHFPGRTVWVHTTHLCSLTMVIYVCNWKLANGWSGLVWPGLASLLCRISTH